MGVSILLIRALTESVEMAGIEREAFFQAGRIEPEMLSDVEVRIELDRYDELQLLALRMTGDEALGLHMGERANLATFDVVGPMSLHAATMREGIDVFRRFHRILSDCPDPELIEEGDRAILQYEFPRSHPRCNRIRAEFGLTVLLRIGKSYVGSDKSVRRATFEHSIPDYADVYRRIFGGASEFDQPLTTLEFDRAWLDRPQLHQNPHLYAALETRARERLLSLGHSPTVAERVRSLVSRSLPVDRLDMPTVARRLGMSERSLRRRLTAEGVSFGDITNEVLGRTAKHLLEDPAQSIQQIAFRMGFSDPSAFYRAFKRWTGMTPNEYRRSMERGDATP